MPARNSREDWYNGEHRHSGLAFFTPSAVHHGDVEQLAATRNDPVHVPRSPSTDRPAM